MGTAQAVIPRATFIHWPLNCFVNTISRPNICGARVGMKFATPDAPPLHFVFTVCDNAAAEVCPLWPGQPMTAHWGVPDPAAVVGSEEIQRRAFRDAFLVLTRRIQLFACLPSDRKPAGSALQRPFIRVSKESCSAQPLYD